ncbi:MAG: hypothetical protein JNJ94_07735, partial [Chlorobi bacterium]|nr:hypothetical protein [Chlorobiota bacterium]
MPDPHTYTNDEGDVLLPWDSVRDMLERLVGQELFSKPLALADLLYHWQRGKPITARDAATRWKWSKTRAAEFIAENRGQVPDKFRTNSGQETGEIAGNHGNRGQVPDKLRTNPGQQRKLPPTPPRRG